MKRPSWLNKNIFAVGLTSFFSDLSHEITTAVLPTFLVNLVGNTLAPQLLGIITGLSDAASTLVGLVSGFISDRVKKRKGLIVAGYAATGIFAGLSGLVTNWVWTLLYRTLAWMGRGLREPPRDALIADSVAPTVYGRAFGFHRAMDSLGAIAGPLFVFLALSHIGVRNIFLVSFIPGALAVLTIWFLTKEEPKKIDGQEPIKFFASISLLPKNFRLFLLIMFIFGIGSFNRTLILLRTQEVLTPVNGLIVASSFSVLLYALRNVFQVMADYIVGHLSDIFGRKVLLATLGFFLFGFVSLGLAFPIPTIWFFVLLFTLSGISAAAYTALESAYAADLLPERLRGTGFGVLQAVDGVSDFISSFAVGFLWSAISPSVGFEYGAVLTILSGFILLGLRKK